MNTASYSGCAQEKLWLSLCRSQQLQRRAAMKRAEKNSLSALKEKIPKSTREDLDWAFSLAFGLVFQQGDSLIKKSCNSGRLAKKAFAGEMILNMDEGRQALRHFESLNISARRSGMLISAIEGMGLGALGIGIPDIVLFVGMLLRGVYETAAQYGFGWNGNQEKMYILRLMECSMLSGGQWLEADSLVEAGLPHKDSCTPLQLRRQMERTASAFCTDLLVLKVVQGLPIVGILGGLGNPLYYRRVLDYAQLKYQRRYVKALMEKEKDLEDH